MKGSIGTLGAIGGLSLVVWSLFYVLTPGAPLTQPETVIIVGVCAAAVLGGRWAWTRLRRPRGQARDQDGPRI